MHINLILGAVFLLAIWWLLRQAAERRRTAKTEPSDMLRDEITRRREAMAQSERAAARLTELKKAKTVEIFAALDDMLDGLPPECHHLHSENLGDEVSLSVQYKEEMKDVFHLGWDIRNFDMGLFAGNEPLRNVPGDYIVRLPDGSLLRDADFQSYMRRLSGLIADRVVRKP